MTFAKAGRTFHATKAKEFRNAKDAREWIGTLERLAFPHIGDEAIGDIHEAHVLRVLTPLWQDRTETATRIRQRIEAVLSWAKVNKLRTGDNPARWVGHLEHTLPSPNTIRKRVHHRALPWGDVPTFMGRLQVREGMSARCLDFVVYTAARSAEARRATWDEIDFDACLWKVPDEHMKSGKPHTAPLSPDAIAMLKRMQATSVGKLVFPAVRGGVLTDMALLVVCQRMEIDATPHGFRSSFKDWARTRTQYADELSELALAHVNNDATRAAYARDGLIDLRRLLMTQWAEHCTGTSVRG
jgi:integrase